MKVGTVRFLLGNVLFKAIKHSDGAQSMQGTCHLCVGRHNKTLCDALPNCGPFNYFKKVRVDV